jgi:hypothetical protein
VNVCVFIVFLSNHNIYIVDGTILCIYNCEVVSRGNLGERKFRLFTNLQMNQKCIFNIADVNNVYYSSNVSDTASAHSGSGTQLTHGALHSFNKNQQLISQEMKGSLKRDTKITYVSSSTIACIPVVLQVFISYLDVFDVSVLLDMNHIIYHAMSGGMPYTVPSNAQVEALRRIHSIVENTNTTTTEIGVEQIRLEEVPSSENITVQQRRRQSLIAEQSAREKYTHLQLLQLAVNEAAKTKPQQTSARINLSKDVIDELLTIVKYCVFSVDNLERIASQNAPRCSFEENTSSVRALMFSALYSIYLRALYEQIPEILLFARSILNVV